MGDRGTSFHARGNQTKGKLGKLGATPVAANRSWTTFAGARLGGDQLAKRLGTAIAIVWFDDDAGANVHFHAPDGWHAELDVPFGEGGKLGKVDHDLLIELAKRKVFTPTRRVELELALSRPARTRDRWIREHGLEQALGLASWEAQPPIDLPTDEAPARFATAERAWTERERAIVALHRTYWNEIFQMNGWKLYTRYKKHLPAERRREVDRLCDCVARGDDDGVDRAVEAILGSIWDADDWLAAIRDPRLAADEPLDPDQLATWRARLDGAGVA